MADSPIATAGADGEAEPGWLPPATGEERLRRWRLLLGGANADGTGVKLEGRDAQIDAALAALYDPEGPGGLKRGAGGGGAGGSRRGGTGKGIPSVARWLGDIREYFPSSVVRVMQKDAMERLQLRQMLLEPETLEAIEPDVSMVANIVALGRVIPEKTKDTARMVVRRVTDQLMKRLEEPMRSAVTGALNRAVRNRRPRFAEMDWNRTIRANLRHYQEEFHTVIPESLIGFGRKARRSQRDVVLCIDQSGSMAESIVYSSIFAAVMASLPAVSTRLVVFDTEVVDLTNEIDDPVDVLFGVQLGGGTYINKAVAYCERMIAEPRNTIFVLISDLFEGGVEAELLQRARALRESGVCFIVLLALSDSGAPRYDDALAQKLAALGAPCFACTPDLFPELMAAAIKREDIGQWAAARDIVAVRAGEDSAAFPRR